MRGGVGGGGGGAKSARSQAVDGGAAPILLRAAGFEFEPERRAGFKGRAGFERPGSSSPEGGGCGGG